MSDTCPPKKAGSIPAPPEYLDQNLIKRWNELSPIAARKGTLTHSTVDAFARYIIAEQEYLRAVQRVLTALRTGNVADASQWSSIQDRFYKEMETSGKAFCLTPGTL